jgi:hypothetical protein
MQPRDTLMAPAPGPLPLLNRFLVYGFAGGVAAVIMFQALFAGLAVLALFVAMGLTWRRDQPPVFPFAIAYQWVYVVVGDLTCQWVPGFGADRYVEDATWAVTVAMCGFVALAFGIWMVWAGRPLAKVDSPGDASPGDYDIRRLFFLTIAAYSINWMLQLAGAAIFFNAANLINNVLLARAVLLCLLWITIMRQRRGFAYGFAALLFVVVPTLASTQSKFKEDIFLALTAVFVGWRPWVRDPGQQRVNRALIYSTVVLTALMIVVGAFWEGGVKAPWRAMGRESTEAQLSGNEKTKSTMEQLSDLDGVVRQAAVEYDLSDGLHKLAKRVDSIGQLALVLNRVPEVVPHENGTLTVHALKHVTMPRMLFPDKENLGTDSWLASTYAGIVVGEGTSIGIGYMAEFYVDFGLAGMMLELAVLGAVLGGFCRLLQRASPSPGLGQAALIVSIVSYFNTFESNIAKLMGGLIVNVLVLWLLLKFLGPALHRWLLKPRGGSKTVPYRKGSFTPLPMSRP